MNDNGIVRGEADEEFAALSDALGSVRSGIFKKRAARAVDAEDVRALAEIPALLDELDSIRGEVKKLSSRWRKLRRLLIAKKRGFAAEIAPRKLRCPPSTLRIEFADGEIIEAVQGADVLKQLIERLGFERVAALGLRLNGKPLLTRRAKGWTIATRSTTQAKHDLINEISKCLELDLHARIIDRSKVSRSESDTQDELW